LPGVIRLQQTGIVKRDIGILNGMTSLPFSDSFTACYFTLGDFELEVNTE
jgi:hypothetical protein